MRQSQKGEEEFNDRCNSVVGVAIRDLGDKWSMEQQTKEHWWFGCSDGASRTPINREWAMQDPKKIAPFILRHHGNWMVPDTPIAVSIDRLDTMARLETDGWRSGTVEEFFADIEKKPKGLTKEFTNFLAELQQHGDSIGTDESITKTLMSHLRDEFCPDFEYTVDVRDSIVDQLETMNADDILKYIIEPLARFQWEHE